jgi:acetyl-CoA acetyltransferase
MNALYVIGVGMTPFGRHPEHSLKQLAGAAVSTALADAGIERRDVQEIHFGNCVQGYMDGQHMIRGHSIFLEQGFQGIPIFNLESGCASGSMAFHSAVRALLAEQADIVLAVGAEKMVNADKVKMFAAFNSAWDVERTDWQMEQIADLWRGFTAPPGTTSDKPYSPFMDVYKGEFFNHVREYGITQRQVAVICAKNHQHSARNPNAQFRVPYTIEEVLAAPPITYPLTLPMCAPISDGAAAAVLCTERALARLASHRRRAIRILGSVTASGMERHPSDLQQHVVARAARKLYEQTAIGPDQVDVAELHDATAVGELIETENLGFCAPGGGGELAENGDTTLGGRIPVNTSGGLESRGHPIAATGLAQIHDLVLQLRGEAGGMQVNNARIALQCNVGGFWGIEEASTHVALLRRD